MQDAWRAYLELALGLTEAPRKKAQTVARRLVGTGGATAAQLQALVEEMVTTGLANREALTKIVRFEVDRALGAVGLATADEVAELTGRVRQLERELREATAARPVTEAAGPSATGSGTRPVASRPVAKKAVAKQTVESKAVAKKAVAKKAVAKKAVATAGGATAGSTEAAEAGRTAPGKRVDARKLPVPAAKKAAARKRQASGEGAG